MTTTHLFLQTPSAGTGARGFSFLLFGSEILTLIIDAKWFIATLLILIVADFRFGWGESHKRYEAAVKAKDKKSQELYKWHSSRALRRTSNKFVDYIVLMLVSTFIGVAFLDPLGYSHVWGTYAGCALAAVCEIMSICGHFFFLRGVKVEKKSIFGFLKAFIVALTKKKSEDVGDALDTALNEK